MRLNLIAVFVAGTLAATLQPALAQMNNHSPERIEFSVDVAEDMNLYTEWHVPTGTEPLRGSFFITEGKIFTAGTIPSTNGEQFDPNSITGSIGTWFCKGTFLVRGSVFDKSKLAVMSDQMYLFPNDQQSIATTGAEGPVRFDRLSAGRDDTPATPASNTRNSSDLTRPVVLICASRSSSARRLTSARPKNREVPMKRFSRNTWVVAMTVSVWPWVTPARSVARKPS